VDEWFNFQIAGYKTHRDHIAIDMSRTGLVQRLHNLASTRDESELRAQYDIKDNCDWNFVSARDALKRISIEESVAPTSYRPFDERWALWGPILMDRPRPGMAELFTAGNVALVCKRQNAIKPFSYALVVNKTFECCIFEGTHGNVMSFPLFSRHDGLFDEGMVPNFRAAVLSNIQELSGLRYTDASGTDDPSCFSARDLFAYLYALLHSNEYRLTYAEHLLQGFPRLPFFHDQTMFRVLVKIGNELIGAHLSEDCTQSEVTSEFIGHPRIEKPRWENNRVLIDKSGLSGFTEVSQEVWNFQVGGYQVCEKWLKDRKGQDLSDSEVVHFKNIVGVITLTLDGMGKIDKTIVEYGGWPDAFQAKSKRT
jgi:predicted helicase